MLISVPFAAPGAYCPEKVKLSSAPEFSFGIKHHEQRPDYTPGK